SFAAFSSITPSPFIAQVSSETARKNLPLASARWAVYVLTTEGEDKSTLSTSSLTRERASSNPTYLFSAGLPSLFPAGPPPLFPAGSPAFFSLRLPSSAGEPAPILTATKPSVIVQVPLSDPFYILPF